MRQSRSPGLATWAGVPGLLDLRILDHLPALIGPSSNAAPSQRAILRPVFPSHTSDDPVQE
jgi:hypothetical protein